MAANTPAHLYLDTAALSKACSTELAKIKKACEDKGKNNKKSISDKLLGPKAKAKLDALKAKVAKAEGAPPWLMEHCDGLWFKPLNSKNNAEIAELAEGLKKLDTGKVVAEVQAHVGEIIRGLDQVVATVAMEAAKGAAVKAGARTLAGSVFGPIGAALVQVINVVDTAITAVEVGGKIINLKDEIGALKKVLEGAPDKLKQMAADAVNNPQKAMADAMSLTAKLDACTRARRCQLVPMKETHDKPLNRDCRGERENEEETELTGPATGKGCCPGQTGHHVLPGSMFKGCTAYGGAGHGCSHQNAPTVCVEGVTNSHGSHGAIHKALKEQLSGKFPAGMTVEQATREGADSVREAFPESGCRKKCIEAQLNAFYKDYKQCEPLKPSDGMGGTRTEDGPAVP